MLNNIWKNMRLVFRWCQGLLWDPSAPLPDSIRGLDLGCGNNKRNGFIGIDKHICRSVDVVCDIEKQFLPFKNDIFDIVFCNHILEHISNLNFILSEVSRILKYKGKMQIIVPWAGHLEAFQDPTHVRFFSINTFEYFVEEGDFANSIYIKKYFKKIYRRSFVFRRSPVYLMLSILVNRSVWLMRFYEKSIFRIFPARAICIELENNI